MNLTEKDFSETLSILSDFKKSRYIIAFSGGVDSLALLTLCVKCIGSEYVVPVYVNHNLRSEKELEEEILLNERNCKTLGVKLIIRTIERGFIESHSKDIGIEARARKLRYEILEEERSKNKCDFILTAHHRNDQIETVLMKIMKKSPVTGLRGISERWNNVLRPLLDYGKDELKEYVRFSGLTFSEDSTNRCNDFERNIIRNEIIPQLSAQMPDCERRILNIRSKAVGLCDGVKSVYDHISLETFLQYNDFQKSVVLYEIWDNIIGTLMPQTLIERVVKDPMKKVGSNGGTFYTDNGNLFLINNADDEVYASFSHKFDFRCEVNDMPFNICIRHCKTDNPTDLFFEESMFKGSVILRFPKQGERIVLKDGSKTINKLLQDMKIPDVLRLRVPVLSDDDGICAVFASVYGGRDRICAKIRTSLAHNNYYKYICTKGNNFYEKNR